MNISIILIFLLTLGQATPETKTVAAPVAQHQAEVAKSDPGSAPNYGDTADGYISYDYGYDYERPVVNYETLGFTLPIVACLIMLLRRASGVRDSYPRHLQVTLLTASACTTLALIAHLCGHGHVLQMALPGIISGAIVALVVLNVGWFAIRPKA